MSITYLKSRGFTLISAIFVVVVLSAFGMSMLVMSTVQQRGSALDLESARAYQAARAGLEWGLYQVQTPAGPPACFGSTNVALTGELSRFVATVQCTLTNYSDGSQNFSMYTLISNACNIPNSGACPSVSTQPNSVERQLKVVTYR